LSAAGENKTREKRGGKQRRGGRERRAANEQNAGDMMDVDQENDAVVVERVTATTVTTFAAAAVAVTITGKDKQKENQQPRANQANAFAAVDGLADKDKPKERENVKPRGNQIDELSRRLAGIAVARAPAAPAVDRKLETPSEEIDAEIVTDPSTVDPAVLAERAVHQKHMHGALDMVSLALVFSLWYSC
jgi:ribosomal protein S30